jgi:hypothetical protein
MLMKEAFALERPSKHGNERPPGYVGTHKTGSITGVGHTEFHRTLANLSGKKRLVVNRRKTGDTDLYVRDRPTDWSVPHSTHEGLDESIRLRAYDSREPGKAKFDAHVSHPIHIQDKLDSLRSHPQGKGLNVSVQHSNGQTLNIKPHQNYSHGYFGEHLGSGASASDFIHDFVNSDNPRFDGKSKKKRIQMALAAHYSRKK